MFDKYKPFGMGKTPRSRIKADKEAVMAMIGNSGEGKIRIKRTGRTAIVWAACIAAVSVMSVSAAAVGGLIDFNALFGGFYKTANENVASTIMKSAENIVCETTDSDYVINVKGIAGDEMAVMLSAELCRADGTPVKEHFINPTDAKSLIPNYFRSYLSTPESNPGSSIRFLINESGNIDITATVDSSEPINGQRVTMKGDTLYDPNDNYWEELKKDQSDREAVLGKYIALDIGWEISFDYVCSGDTLASKTVTSDIPFTYYMPLMKKGSGVDYELEGVYDIQVEGINISAGAVACRIEFEYPATEYDRLLIDHDYVIGGSEYNEFFLIMSDGSQIALYPDTYSFSLGSDTCIRQFDLHYSDDSDIRIIADIENAAAISINGIVYPLS